MPTVVVDADSDISETRSAVPVYQCPQQSETAVDGILRSHCQVHRQVVWHACHLGGVGESSGTDKHVFRRSGVDTESAQRIGEIRVDDGLIARKPVEIGPGRLEWSIEGGKVQIVG
jgi:hypothetical protein